MTRREYEERIESPGIFDPEIDDTLPSYGEEVMIDYPHITEGYNEDVNIPHRSPSNDTDYPIDRNIPDGWRTPLEPLSGGPDGDWGQRPIIGGPWTPGGPSGPPIPSGQPGKGPCQIEPITPPETVLGYYVPRQVIERIMVRCGLNPQSIDEFNVFNFEDLPRENRFGIHLISKHIEQYVDRQVERARQDLPVQEAVYFEKYFRYLFWSYVLGHEWGHYLAENMSVECRRSFLSVHTGKKAELKMVVPRYLPHLDAMTAMEWLRRNAYEEVLAEWAGLRYGVFNYHLSRPKRLPRIGLVEKELLARVWLLKKGIVNAINNGIKPYRDVAYWVDLNELFSHETAMRFVRKDRNISKTIHNAIRIPGGRGRFTLLDILENNLLAFTPSNRHHRQISYCPSNGNGFLTNPGRIPASMRYQLGIKYPQLPQYSAKRKSKALIKFDLKTIGGESSYCFPALNYTDTLELPEVMIH